MLLTIKDLSSWLNIKPSTLYLWAAQGKIPCQKIHGLIRFDREQMTGWLESFDRKPPDIMPAHSHGNRSAVDQLIEAAKRDVYTPATGKPDQQRAQRERRDDGAR